MQHVLAGASTTGYTVVWDLRGKREVVALAYGGGTGTLAGQHVGSMNGLAVGGRRGMSDIAWHPDNVSWIVQGGDGINIASGYETRDRVRGRFFTNYYGLGSP